MAGLLQKVDSYSKLSSYRATHKYIYSEYYTLYVLLGSIEFIHHNEQEEHFQEVASVLVLKEAGFSGELLVQ